MKIPVVGFDPSMLNWGIAEAMLDLETGYLDTPHLTVVRPEQLAHKQVRNSSKDLYRIRQLAQTTFDVARRAKFVFAEIPSGTQSARGMACYGVCLGLLGALQSQGISLIEVSAMEVKVALSGDKNASKELMIQKALEFYPDANWPMVRGKLAGIAEHAADAIGAIHAGVLTPAFQNLLKLCA